MAESGSSSFSGIDHVSLIAADLERTVQFYVDILGLRILSRDPGDASSRSTRVWLGDTGSGYLTIAQAADRRPGELGVGTIHHMALTVAGHDALLKWKRWLQYKNALAYGPYDQQAYEDLVLADPDGVLIELATYGPGWGQVADVEQVYSPPTVSMAPYRDEDRIRVMTWPEPVTEIEPDMTLQGLHHVATITSALERTDAFYRDALGLPLVRKTLDSDDPEVERWYWGLNGGRPGTLITAFPVVHPDEGGTSEPGRLGPGVAAHYALGTSSPRNVGDRVAGVGIEVASDVDERGREALTVHDPDDLLIELVRAHPDWSGAGVAAPG